MDNQYLKWSEDPKAAHRVDVYYTDGNGVPDIFLGTVDLGVKEFVLTPEMAPAERRFHIVGVRLNTSGETTGEPSNIVVSLMSLAGGFVFHEIDADGFYTISASGAATITTDEDGFLIFEGPEGSLSYDEDGFILITTQS